MGNGEEQFCLRWNDFQDSLLSTLQEIRADEDFVDVTLVCGNGQQLPAHKLILSACSEFFRNLLKRNPAPNPVIVLWDMTVEDVKNILRFMYNGEVQVEQQHLTTFLTVAERLRVRGLCQSDGKSPNPSRATPSPTPGNQGSTKGSTGGNPSSSIRRSSSPQPGNQNRRRSHSDTNSDFPNKKPKRSASEEDDDMNIKEESQDRSSPGPGSSYKGNDPGSRGNDDGQMRSHGGSDDDYAEYGYAGEGYDDHGVLPSALMGMTGRRIMDQAAAKEIWQRAALAQIGLANPRGSPNPFHHRGSMEASSPSEPARRQRSVYTSYQIAELEKHFQINEYIDGERKRQLSLATNIPEQQIKVWFQNRRQKKKREAEEQQHNVSGSGFSGSLHHSSESQND